MDIAASLDIFIKVSNEHDLHTFMAQVSADMASEYIRIHSKAADDPGTAGDESEENWASLLREWLPSNYHVTTKGRLIGSNGDMSPQIDVLVLKPFYPKKLQEKKVWLADGVAAAFECKTTLKAQDIRESAERCRKFKALFANGSGSPERELRSSLIYGVLAHSHVWKSRNSKPIDLISTHLADASNSCDHPRTLIDAVCVADLGTWSTSTSPYYRAEWKADDRALLESYFGGQWGATTAMICSSSSAENQAKHFQPVGAMIAYLTQRLAWNDAPLRELADYYRKAQLWGSGSGRMRFWPQSVFSDEVRSQIEMGRCTNGAFWDGWSMHIR